MQPASTATLDRNSAEFLEASRRRRDRLELETATTIVQIRDDRFPGNRDAWLAWANERLGHSVRELLAAEQVVEFLRHVRAAEDQDLAPEGLARFVAELPCARIWVLSQIPPRELGPFVALYSPLRERSERELAALVAQYIDRPPVEDLFEGAVLQ